MGPMNLVESVPPNISSPFVSKFESVGLKNTAISFCGIVPCSKRLSVTVVIAFELLGISLPSVKSSGPRLQKNVFNTIRNHRQTPMQACSPQNPVKRINVRDVRGNTYGLPRNNHILGNRHRVGVLST